MGTNLYMHLNEDVNFVRTNHGPRSIIPRKWETQSAEVVLQFAVSCTEAVQNPHRISVEFVGFRKVSCDMYRRFKSIL